MTHRSSLTDEPLNFTLPLASDAAVKPALPPADPDLIGTIGGGLGVLWPITVFVVSVLVGLLLARLSA